MTAGKGVDAKALYVLSFRVLYVQREGKELSWTCPAHSLSFCREFVLHHVLKDQLRSKQDAPEWEQLCVFDVSVIVFYGLIV